MKSRQSGDTGELIHKDRWGKKKPPTHLEKDEAVITFWQRSVGLCVCFGAIIPFQTQFETEPCKLVRGTWYDPAHHPLLCSHP